MQLIYECASFTIHLSISTFIYWRRSLSFWEVNFLSPIPHPSTNGPWELGLLHNHPHSKPTMDSTIQLFGQLWLWDILLTQLLAWKRRCPLSTCGDCDSALGQSLRPTNWMPIETWSSQGFYNLHAPYSRFILQWHLHSHKHWFNIKEDRAHQTFTFIASYSIWRYLLASSSMESNIIRH